MSGNDVVQVEIFAIECPATILAHVFVALKDVVTRELNFLLGKFVKEEQEDDPRQSDLKRNRVNVLGTRLVLGEILPLGEAKSLERPVIPAGNDFGTTLE